MCSICGMIDRCGHADKELVAKMGLTMKNRGPDASEGFSDSFVALHHNRLAVMDPQNGAQPMSATYGGREYIIVYNGEIYNAPELKGGWNFAARLSEPPVIPKLCSGAILFSVLSVQSF